MAQYVCYNKNGITSATNENKISVLSQWDTNRTIVIREIPEGIINNIKIQFSGTRDKTAYVVVPTVGDGYISVVVPNELLMMPDDIILYIVETTQSGEVRTVDRIVIPVTPRPMPPEYIYIDEATGIHIADDIATINNMIYLTDDGEPFGSGVDLSN